MRTMLAVLVFAVLLPTIVFAAGPLDDEYWDRMGTGKNPHGPGYYEQYDTPTHSSPRHSGGGVIQTYPGGGVDVNTGQTYYGGSDGLYSTSDGRMLVPSGSGYIDTRTGEFHPR